MLARDEGREFQIRAEEIPHLRHCLRWLRAHNPHFKVFWANAERFGVLYQRLQAVLPQGNLHTPIRIQRNKAVEGAVGAVVEDTMEGDDAVLVVLDPGEFPSSWAVVDDLADAVGSMSVRDENAGQEASAPLDPALCSDVSDAAQNLRSTAHAKLSDPHLDAKVFPHLHPWGSGSLYSQDGSGGMHHLARARLLSLDPAFRTSAVWSFWMLDRLLKNDLYFRHLQQKRSAADAGLPEVHAQSEKKPRNTEDVYG